MIRQDINIDNKWRVVVFFSIDYDLFKYVAYELQRAGCKKMEENSIYHHLVSGMALAFTYSSIADKVSIVGFCKHRDKADYLSSIVHEAEHVKQAMLEYYGVKDSGEPPAYTIGYIVKKMYKVFKQFI